MGVHKVVGTRVSREQSATLATGVTVTGEVRLHSESVGDCLFFASPPGGLSLYREGLGRRRFFLLSEIERDVAMSDFVGRMREQLSRIVSGEQPSDEAFIRSYPGIHEFLGRTKLEDGRPRARSKVTLFYDGNLWKCSLTEPDAEASAFVTGETFMGVLATLEESIQGDLLDWRRWWVGGKSPRMAKRG